MSNLLYFILYKNQQLNFGRLNDTINALRLESTGHFQYGLASGLGAMFGILISFLVFILFKKFKHRNNPVKYSSSNTTLQDSRYYSVDIINCKPAEKLQQIEL